MARLVCPARVTSRFSSRLGEDLQNWDLPEPKKPEDPHPEPCPRRLVAVLSIGRRIGAEELAGSEFQLLGDDIFVPCSCQTDSPVGLVGLDDPLMGRSICLTKRSLISMRVLLVHESEGAVIGFVSKVPKSRRDLPVVHPRVDHTSGVLPMR